MNNAYESEYGLSEFEAELVPDERRTEARRVTLLQAGIRVSEDSAPIACVVTDLTKSGARVLFEDVPALPGHVHLLIHHPESTHKCEVRWTNGDEIGLMFVS